MKSAAQRRSILLASIGTSPGVLTNAVWALAHQEKTKTSLKESPVAFTAAQKALMNSSFVKAEKSAWGQIRRLAK